jgi:hypothetical protein
MPIFKSPREQKTHRLIDAVRRNVRRQVEVDWKVNRYVDLDLIPRSRVVCKAPELDDQNRRKFPERRKLLRVDLSALRLREILVPASEEFCVLELRKRRVGRGAVSDGKGRTLCGSIVFALVLQKGFL